MHIVCHMRHAVTNQSILMEKEIFNSGTVGVTVGPKSGTVAVALVGSPLNPTRDWVKEQFSLAATAMRCLPLTALERPTGLRSGMPEIVRSQADIFSAQVQADGAVLLDHKLDAEARNRARACATPEQIAALNRVVDWLLWLSRPQQIVVMGRAFHRTVTTIARKLDCSRPTVYSEERKAYDLIVRRLKKSF